MKANKPPRRQRKNPPDLSGSGGPSIAAPWDDGTKALHPKYNPDKSACQPKKQYAPGPGPVSQLIDQALGREESKLAEARRLLRLAFRCFDEANSARQIRAELEKLIPQEQAHDN